MLTQFTFSSKITNLGIREENCRNPGRKSHLTPPHTHPTPSCTHRSPDAVQNFAVGNVDAFNTYRVLSGHDTHGRGKGESNLKTLNENDHLMMHLTVVRIATRVQRMEISHLWPFPCAQRVLDESSTRSADGQIWTLFQFQFGWRWLRRSLLKLQRRQNYWRSNHDGPR